MLFLLLTLGLLVLVWLLASPLYWWRKGVPFIMPLPVFGSFLPALYLSAKDFFDDIYYKRTDAPYIGIHMFTRPALFLRDPKIVTEIFEEKAPFFASNGVYTHPDRDPIATSVFHLSNLEWKNARAKLSPQFSPAKVKNLVNIGRTAFEKLIAEVENQLDQNGDGSEIDVKSRAMFMTVDFTAASIFGVESSVFKEKETNKFYTSAKDVNSAVSMLKILISMISRKLYDIFNFVSFTPNVNDFILNLIQTSVASRLKNTGSTKVLMDGLLEVINNNKDFDEKFLTGQATIMFSGGVETTSQTLTFALYELANNQSLQSELRSKLGSPEGHALLKNIIQETLRKYPLFGMLSRMCTKSCKLSTGLEVEKDTLMIVSTLSLHQDPKLYPEPEKFLPGRELPKGAYLPFGLGPRICLGMLLSTRILEEVLTSLITKYEFSPGQNTSGPLTLEANTFFTTPKGSVMLKVTRIKENEAS